MRNLRVAKKRTSRHDTQKPDKKGVHTGKDGPITTAETALTILAEQVTGLVDEAELLVELSNRWKTEAKKRRRRRGWFGTIV